MRLAAIQHLLSRFVNNVVAKPVGVGLTRKILRTLLSDSSPANLLPVPSKQSTNCLVGRAGPIGTPSMVVEVGHCSLSRLSKLRRRAGVIRSSDRRGRHARSQDMYVCLGCGRLLVQGDISRSPYGAKGQQMHEDVFGPGKMASPLESKRRNAHDVVKPYWVARPSSCSPAGLDSLGK